MTRRATGWTVINALVVIYALLPVLWILSLSLKPTSAVKDGKLIPSSITFANYKGIFTGDVFSSALINSIGNLAGFLGPYLIGWVKETTGSTSTGLLVLSLLPLAAGLLVFLGSHETKTEFVEAK